MKLLVTGATGFTGSHTVPLLLEKGFQLRCLVRPSSDLGGLDQRTLEIHQGDLSDPQSLASACRGVQGLVNIASIGFGHTPFIVDAVRSQGIQRALFVSTTAIFTTLKAGSKSTRLAAEKTIADSGLDFTVLRPTMIYGSGRDRNICRLIRYLDRWPIMPVLGDGTHLQQPVYVKDVANAIADALMSSRTSGRFYNIAGRYPLTFNDMIDTVCSLLGRRVYKLFLPAQLFATALGILEAIKVPLPIKAEQIQRLNENKAFDYTDAARDFNYWPRSFSEGVRLEIAELKRKTG